MTASPLTEPLLHELGLMIDLLDDAAGEVAETATQAGAIELVKALRTMRTNLGRSRAEIRKAIQ